MGTPPEVATRVIFATVIILSIAALGHAVGPASPWFGLVASFCVLGLLDLMMPFVRLRLPRSLREVRSWEIRGGVYRALGVPAFGAFLRGSPVRLLNRKVYLKACARGLAPVRTHIENAEAAHFWGGLATIPYLLLAWIRGWWDTLAVVVLFDLIVNIYPILHLRSVRLRIDNAIRRDLPHRLSGKSG